METKRFILGVDLDGVCADFAEGIRPVAAEWLGVDIKQLTREVTYGFKEWGLDLGEYEKLHRFAVMQRDLFRRLKPIENGPAVLRRLDARNDIRIRIITHRLYIKHFHVEAVQQTTEWLDHHGIPYWDLCFMREKAAVGADLYIEDSPHNLKQLQAADHETIIFTNSTNRNEPIEGLRADSWLEVEELIHKKLEES